MSSGREETEQEKERRKELERVRDAQRTQMLQEIQEGITAREKLSQNPTTLEYQLYKPQLDLDREAHIAPGAAQDRSLPPIAERKKIFETIAKSGKESTRTSIQEPSRIPKERLEGFERNKPPLPPKPSSAVIAARRAEAERKLKEQQATLATPGSMHEERIAPDPAKAAAALARFAPTTPKLVEPSSPPAPQRPIAAPDPALPADSGAPVTPSIPIQTIVPDTALGKLIDYIDKNHDAQIKPLMDGKTGKENKAEIASKMSSECAQSLKPLSTALLVTPSTALSETDDRKVYHIEPEEEGPIFMPRKTLDGKTLKKGNPPEIVYDIVYYVGDGTGGFKPDLTKSFIAPDGHPDGSMTSAPKALREACWAHHKDAHEKTHGTIIAAPLAAAPPPPPPPPPLNGTPSEVLGTAVEIAGAQSIKPKSLQSQITTGVTLKPTTKPRDWPN